MTNKELYNFAYQFLLEKDGVTENLIQKHFQPEYNKPKSINDIFQRLCETAQNKQMSTKVIVKTYPFSHSSKLNKMFFQRG